jgi:hypothetical protein
VGKECFFTCVVQHNARCYCSVEEAANEPHHSDETIILDQDYCASIRTASSSSQQVRAVFAVPTLYFRAGSIKASHREFFCIVNTMKRTLINKDKFLFKRKSSPVKHLDGCVML